MIEDSTAKLHRRTSYLMATARDRSNNATTTVQGTSFNLTIPEEPPYVQNIKDCSKTEEYLS